MPKTFAEQLEESMNKLATLLRPGGVAGGGGPGGIGTGGIPFGNELGKILEVLIHMDGKDRTPAQTGQKLQAFGDAIDRGRARLGGILLTPDEEFKIFTEAAQAFVEEAPEDKTKKRMLENRQARAEGKRRADSLSRGIDKGFDKAEELLIGESPGKKVSALGEGVMQAGGLMGGKVGLAIMAVGAFGKVAGESVERLRKWNAEIEKGHYRFAEFSGAMAQVRAESEVRNIYLSQERGERRAQGADAVARSGFALERSLSRYEDLYARQRDRFVSSLSELATAVADRGAGAAAAGAGIAETNALVASILSRGLAGRIRGDSPTTPSIPNVAPAPGPGWTPIDVNQIFSQLANNEEWYQRHGRPPWLVD